MNEILGSVSMLAQDQYGNYVVQVVVFSGNLYFAYYRICWGKSNQPNLHEGIHSFCLMSINMLIRNCGILFLQCIIQCVYF